MITDDSQKVARRQKLLAATILGGILVASVVFLVTTDGSSSKPRTSVAADRASRIQVGQVTTAGRPEHSWLDASDLRFKELERNNKQLQEQLTKLTQQLGNLSKTVAEKDEEIRAQADDASRVIDALEMQLKAADEKLAALGSGGAPITPASAPGTMEPAGAGQFPSNDPFRTVGRTSDRAGREQAARQLVDGGRNAESAGVLENVRFNLAGAGDRERRRGKDTKYYVPAGAYVGVEVLSGVDASVGVTSQADPRPVLLRLKGPAYSALHDGEPLETDLDGCMVTGAAFGDLSSEKVYVRPQILTCGTKNGRVIETRIKGFLAGNGRAGIRGQVVSREGDLIWNTALAGVIGGFGRGVSQATAGNLGGGILLNTDRGGVNAGDVLKGGLGEGVGKSADRLSEYLIQRAEQYQPVIELYAGRPDVELVFLEGVYIDGRDQLETIPADEQPQAGRLVN